LRISININEGGLLLAFEPGTRVEQMILCQCSAVTDATIEKLINEGASNLRAIVKSCGAGRRCAPCRDEINAMLCRAGASAGYDGAGGVACAN
jgi:bacterioferritin-associated ferredoxin